MTDQLAVLYHLWGQETPTLFDPMTLVFVLRPELCPVTAMHIRVDEKGSRGRNRGRRTRRFVWIRMRKTSSSFI